MTYRMFDGEYHRWRHMETSAFVDGEWTTNKYPEDPSVWRGSMFWPHYWGEGTVFTRDVRDMPLAANSAASAAWMNSATPWTPGGGFGSKTSLNTSVSGTMPIATYVVDSTAPGAEWQYMDSVSAGAGFSNSTIDIYCKGKIPLPTWAVPAQNGDRGLALYDLGTGIMREYFMVTPVEGKPGHWKAGTGGYSLNNPGLSDLAVTNPGLQLLEGTSAAVGMHNPLGFIGIAEVLGGHIGHALAFTTSQMNQGLSWPAIGSDGTLGREDDPKHGTASPDAPVEGQWARLPESLDEEKNPDTNAPWNPLTKLIIKAAKRYGLVATDKNLFVHAFNVEDGHTWKQLYGTDPWAVGGICRTALNDNLSVADFPWHLTEWAEVDWGRPSPDFWLRRGETVPWVSP